MKSEGWLKVLAFILGFKHKSPAEQAEGGKQLVLDALRRMVAVHLPTAELQEIHLIGAIAHSAAELAAIEAQLRHGRVPAFSFPTSLDNQDFINFYRITTRTDTYVGAVSDHYDYLQQDRLLMWEKVRATISVDHLPVSHRYL